MTAQDLLHLSARVGGRAEILDIRLHKFEFQVFLDSPSEPPYELQSEVDVRCSRHTDEGETVAAYYVEFSISAAPAGGERIFQAVVEHAMAYGVGGGHTDDELEAFGLTSAVFACYPYVRELLQSATGRAGLVPLILPVRRNFLPEPDAVTSKPAPPAKKATAAKKAAAKKGAKRVAPKRAPAK